MNIGNFSMVKYSMDLGYMLFIQMCGLFWNLKNKTVKQKQIITDLKLALPKYQFLGICAEIWRFMPLNLKNRWQEEAIKLFTTKPSLNYTRQLVSEIEVLAELTLKNLKV